MEIPAAGDTGVLVLWKESRVKNQESRNNMKSMNSRCFILTLDSMFLTLN